MNVTNVPIFNAFKKCSEVISGESYNFYFDWWGFGIFFYEMIYGRPPFTGNNPKEIYKKILNNEILIESNSAEISHEAKDLILSLLNKDKESRIHPSKIKNHPFFKDIDFDSLNENTPFSYGCFLFLLA